ncbi:class A beta-lactamase-related serine hydrolase [Secundilactobacillus paracollinoides]|uniref:class A beta-lactamase-related serine hydrolase n=1 Tax=Secundilactobacillus paracollinoides TaxID=240427 RepID=UPI001F34FDFC|nr:class A beta-lactamase-related serine hydrolase [Secundilactobacillus paracollinoides]
MTLGVVLLAGRMSCAASITYNSILSMRNHRYDAQIVHQIGKGGYALYTAGPYHTNRRTLTRDAIGSDHTNQYVRVMQTKVTRTGTYVKLRYFNQQLGWMNSHGIKRVSFASVIAGTMAQANFSGTAALISAGKTQPTVVSAGLADASTKTANSNNGTVLYPLASLQKAITGALIQQLISQRKLSPSTPLSRYYPQVAGSQRITISELLSMTSGITNPEQFPRQSPSETQAVSLALKTLKTSTNKTFQYSDDNYVLLAGIIAKVTGNSYAANVQTRVLTKLGLTHTFLVTRSQPSLTATLAQSATWTPADPYATPQSVTLPRFAALVGAGNMLTTPGEFTAVIQGMQNGQILTKKQYRQLLRYGTVYSGGFYVNRDGIKYNNGSFSGLTYHTGYYATTGNYHAAIVFSNRAPLRNGLSQKDFVAQLYRVAVYY